MADNPDTGAGLSELDGVSALAKIRQARQAPSQDKPEPKDEPAQPAEPDEEEAGQPEAEGDEPEAEGEGSTETEDTPDEPAQPAEPEEITLPSGKRITAKEAAEGYLRREDHTRRLMELAEQRKAIERERSEVFPRLKQLTEALESQVGKEPDWVKLAQEKDPWEFQKIKTEWDAKALSTKAAREQLEQAQRQRLVEAQAETRRALMTDGWEKSWSTEDGLRKGVEQIAAFAVEFGFTPNALQSVTDPNVIKVLELARRQYVLEKTAPAAREKLKGKPKPLKPGAKPAQTTVDRELQKSKNSFAQKKDMQSGLNVLAQIRAKAAKAAA